MMQTLDFQRVYLHLVSYSRNLCSVILREPAPPAKENEIVGSVFSVDDFCRHCSFLAAYMTAVLLLWRTFSWLGREKSPPRGYTRLPTPPQIISTTDSGKEKGRFDWIGCRLRALILKERVLYGTKCAKVKALFDERRGNRWFRFKALTNSMLLAHHEDWRGGLSTVSAALKHHLASLLENAEYYRLRPERPLTLWGYASNTGFGHDGVVLGLEPCALALPVLANSAADHELVHYVQHGFRKAFDIEWSCNTVSKTLSTMPKRLSYEFLASVLGGPVY